MTTTPVTSPIAAWLRPLCAWIGVFLMAMSLCGGYRVASRMTDETSAEELTEVEEFANRQSDGGSNRRRTRPEADVRVQVDVASVATRAAQPADRLFGESPDSGHLIANGLRAPLRC